MQAIKFMKMKKNHFIIILLAVFVTACIKNDEAIWRDPKAEWDATTWNANAVGVIYPVMPQVSGFGRAVATENTLCNAALVDTFITRTTGAMTIRVNVIGEQAKVDREVGYKIIPIAASVPTVSFRKKTPVCGDNTLTLQDAQEGVHFTVPAGKKIIIPANSSFGYLRITILNPGPTTGIARVIGLEIDDSGALKPNPNYAKLALAIDQR